MLQDADGTSRRPTALEWCISVLGRYGPCYTP